MNAILRSCAVASVALASFGPALAGCGGDKSTTVSDAGVVDSGPSQPVLGGKLGAAVRAAESAQAAPPSGPNQGPPETGIFAPGAADAAQAPGAPPKIEVLGEGTEPRFALTSSPAGEEQKAVLSVNARFGPQAGVPPIDLALAMKIDKSRAVTAKVVSAAPAKEIAGQVPKELGEALAKLKGSEFRFQLLPDGSVAGATETIAKDAEPQLDVALRVALEGLTVFAAPLPSKPVGVGAYWMVADRNSALGIDAVRYRVYRVEKIAKDQATLSVDVRQYAAKDEADLGALSGGQKLKFDQFESSGKATVEWALGSIVTPGSQFSSRTRIQMGGGPKGAQPRGIQMEIAASALQPEKGDKKK